MLPRAVFALFVLSAVCARADLTILQEISSPDSPKSAVVTTTKCKGDKLRVDVGGTASMIIDSKKGGMISLMHQQKVAIPMSETVQKLTSQLAEKATSSDPVQLQATGRKETLIGLPCEEYTGTIAGQKATIWTTKDVPEYKEFSEHLLSLSPQLRQYQGPLAGNAALQGFPVLTELTAADGKKTTIRVQAVSRDAIADSVFRIPDGYRKMELPQIQGMPSGR